MESTAIARPATWSKEHPHTKAIVYFREGKIDGFTFNAREKGRDGGHVKDPRALGIYRLKKMVDSYHLAGKLNPKVGAILYDLQTGVELYRFKDGQWV